MKAKRFLSILGYVFLGYAITLLLVTVKDAVEHTAAGREAELSAYRFLQRQLSQIDDGLPVVVVDITEVPGRDAGQVTPRDTLRGIIEALVAKRPRAIALDIDFSPGGAGLRDPVNDKAFLDYCLSVSREQGVPIFLGVYNAQAADPDTWLGLEQYREMAVSLDILPDTSHMPLVVKADGVDAPLPALGAALADAYRKEAPGPPAWIRPALLADGQNRPGSEYLRPRDSEFTYELAPVNFSKLEQIIEGRREVSSAASIRESIDRFTNKMVIVGDGTRGDDQFIVSGREMPVLGVFLHACAAYTRAREPLYEFKHSARLLLDFAVSSVTIFLVAFMRVRNPQEEHDEAWHKRQWRYVLLSVILTLGAGMLLVRGLKVMWLDFFLVIFALLLHTPVERRAAAALKGLWGRLKALWGRLRGGTERAGEAAAPHAGAEAEIEAAPPARPAATAAEAAATTEV